MAVAFGSHAFLPVITKFLFPKNTLELKRLELEIMQGCCKPLQFTP